jgi:hypothetical protein
VQGHHQINDHPPPPPTVCVRGQAHRIQARKAMQQTHQGMWQLVSSALIRSSRLEKWLTLTLRQYGSSLVTATCVVPLQRSCALLGRCSCKKERSRGPSLRPAGSCGACSVVALYTASRSTLLRAVYCFTLHTASSSTLLRALHCFQQQSVPHHLQSTQESAAGSSSSTFAPVARAVLQAVGTKLNHPSF